jgi:hypothetical protein
MSEAGIGVRRERRDRREKREREGQRVGGRRQRAECSSQKAFPLEAPRDCARDS